MNNKEFIFNINKEQTNILKAIGIILIVFHNFLHWTNSIGENEFDFDPNRFVSFIDLLFASLSSFINSLFSYLGHYGVQIFIFISGYGLTKQYVTKPKISYKQYIIPKLTKIYSLLIAGLIFYILFFFRPLNFENILSLVVSTLFMYNNFSFDTIFRFPYIGPWWYFSLTIQLYLLFPFIFAFYKRYGAKISFVGSFLLIYLLLPITERYNIPLFGNFIGHLPEFLLGISIALSNRFKYPIILFSISFFVFILANLYPFFFPLSFLSITILLLFTFWFLTINISRGLLLKPLLFIGNISAFIFISNGPIRAFTIPYFVNQTPSYILLGSVIHFLLVVAISYSIQIIFLFVNSKIHFLPTRKAKQD